MKRFAAGVNFEFLPQQSLGMPYLRIFSFAERKNPDIFYIPS
ncbi:MAG: hypothetical protein BWY31_00733 [Lentisphaerae bacterium ADurb.Bin242]|nr:MAG: hypothetical protein BWY31_00733 [Lentisphaerae bacterium ADurb.Bin242]